MGFCVCNGAITSCPFGLAPGMLTIIPSTAMCSYLPMGTCISCIPFVNITPFGLCTSLANPITAAQTAAAFGVLTPGTCIPTPIGTWAPLKPSLMSKTGPLLTSDSILSCAFGGVIKINMPAQFKVMTK